MKKILLQKGVECFIVAFKDPHIILTSTISSPPGSSLEGFLDSQTEINIKVRTCKKQGDGFMIEGRVVNAHRVLLDQLSSLVAQRSPKVNGSNH